MSSKPKETRRNTRAPVTLEVHYRTAGSFLVSYSLNLSRGGLFLETNNRLPVGTTLAVRFSMPQVDEPIETEAKVVWQRTKTSREGDPPGLGLSFDQLDNQIGARIDQMVRGFNGVTMLAVASSSVLDRLVRNLCNVISSSVQRASDRAEALERLDPQLDLVVVDMESIDSDDCLSIIEAATGQPTPAPVVALVTSPRQEAVANAAGVALTLRNPVNHEELRNKVLALLSKPASLSP